MSPVSTIIAFPFLPLFLSNLPFLSYSLAFFPPLDVSFVYTPFYSFLPFPRPTFSFPDLTLFTSCLLQCLFPIPPFPFSPILPLFLLIHSFLSSILSSEEVEAYGYAAGYAAPTRRCLHALRFSASNVVVFLVSRDRPFSNSWEIPVSRRLEHNQLRVLCWASDEIIAYLY